MDKMGVVAKGEVLLVCDRKFSKEIPVKGCEKEYTGKKIYQTEYEINHKTFVIKNPIKRFNNAKNDIAQMGGFTDSFYFYETKKGVSRVYVCDSKEKPQRNF